MDKPGKKPAEHPGLTWLGTVSKPHGIKGEVVVNPQTDTPDFYLGLQKVMVESGGALKSMKVSRNRVHKNSWVMELDGIADRDQAEAMRGSRILVADEDLRPLDDDEVFIHDLIGCRVLDTAGAELGKLVDYLETGGHGVYVVQAADGVGKGAGTEFMIPGVPDMVKSVDVASRTIVVDPPEGMLDL